MLALCGLGVFGAIYHSAGIGWIIRTAREQGHAMGVNGLWGSAGLALYGIVPGRADHARLVARRLHRARRHLPRRRCRARLADQAGQGRRPADAGDVGRAARAAREFWRVFSVLSVTMALEGVIWSAVMFGAALVFETRLAGDIASLRDGLASWGVVTQAVLWVGLATSMIYVVSGIAQYAMGRRIIDRYPLKSTYVTASALQVAAMLALAMGDGYVALAGAIASAVLSSAAGPVENILIARYTPSRYHGLGFGAKFVVALGASPIAIVLIAWVRKTTGSLDCPFPRPGGARRGDHPGRAVAAGQRTARERCARRCRSRPNSVATWRRARPCRLGRAEAAVEPCAGIGERAEVELDRLAQLQIEARLRSATVKVEPSR